MAQHSLFLVSSERKFELTDDDLEKLSDAIEAAIGDSDLRGKFEVIFLWNPDPRESLKILRKAKRMRDDDGEDDGDDGEDGEDD